MRDRVPDTPARERAKRAAFETSPLSTLLVPLSPRTPDLSSPESEEDAGGGGETWSGFAREDEPSTPRGDALGVFAAEMDGAARWDVGAFECASGAKSVELERRRGKTRSGDFDEMGFDFRECENEEPLEMFRVFGKEIGKPPKTRGGSLGGNETTRGRGLFGSFGGQRSGQGSGSGSGSFGSREPGEGFSALSRMNSLAETKVLTSTLLVRQTSVTADAAFDFDDHFRYEQQIGFSQNSEVWLVTSKTSGSAFVVKKCLHSLTTEAQRAKYKREVEAAALLPEHPNVVRYYRSWQQDQHFYIQMEHCACGSLSSVFARLPPQTLIAELDVWRLAAQVASGLAFMHLHKIVHLDIKPDNIYIDVNGTCKIGDFGLAYVQDSGWDWEEGDGGYVAPELLNVSPGQVPETSADMYSLGVTLYEAASGIKFPRGASSIPPLPEGRSRELARVIEACLNTDPAKRATAQDVATFAHENVAALEKAH